MEIHARNVEEAWAIFRTHMAYEGTRMRRSAPRGMATVEFEEPVVTYYHRPEECVLLDPVRDCNPFFHLYEALWMLAGRNDVERVAYYSRQISKYSDNGTWFHGAYGARWRKSFAYDQLAQIVKILQTDPDSRRAVLSMWDGMVDLHAAMISKDVPCNTAAYFRRHEDTLELTVVNRSNDAVWGCYGANAVHFSFLLQYVARELGLRPGRYVQVSNCLHVYLSGAPGEVWNRISATPVALKNDYTPAVSYLKQDFTLRQAELVTQAVGPITRWDPEIFESFWMHEVAVPMLSAYARYKEGAIEQAIERLEGHMTYDAWIVAGKQWLERRLANRGGGAR